MKRKVGIFFVTFVVWCLLNWRPDAQHLWTGLVVAGAVAFLTVNLFSERRQLLFQPRRYLVFFMEYLPLFLWEGLKANLGVAYRVLHPHMPICPGVVEVRTKVKSDLALTVLANTLTLASGNLTIDVDPEKQILLVHCMDVTVRQGKNSAQETVGRFENILSRIFEEGA